MNNEEYVLIGKWEEDMEKKNSIPTLFEIRKYFSPGKMIMVPYFKDGSSNSHGRLLVEEGIIFRGIQLIGLLKEL